MLALRCPSCQKVFQVDIVPQMVSAIVSCPFCDQKSQVPGMAGHAGKDTQIGRSRQSTLHDIPAAPSSPVQDPTRRAPQAARPARPRNRSRSKKLAIALTLILLCAGGALAMLYFFVWSRTPLSVYATILPDKAVSVIHLDVVACRKPPELRDQLALWERSFAESTAGLEWIPPGVKINSWLAACTTAGETLQVWTFERPISFGKKPAGRFQAQSDQEPIIYDDVFDPPNGWAIDGAGRLLRGPVSLVAEALQGQKSGTKSQAYDRLARWAKEAPDQAFVWVVMNPSQGLPEGPFPLVHGWTAFKKAKIEGLMAAVTLAPPLEAQLEGKVFFAGSKDAEDFRTLLAMEMSTLPMQPFAPQMDPVRLAGIVQGCRWESDGALGKLKMPLPLAMVGAGFTDAAAAQGKQTALVQARVRKAIDEHLGRSTKSLGLFPFNKELATEQDFAAAAKAVTEAIDSIGKALDLGEPAQDRLQAAKTYLDEVKLYQEHAKRVHVALKDEDLERARQALEEAKRVRPGDPGLRKLDQEIAALEAGSEFKKLCDEGHRALAAKQWTEAQGAFEKARSHLPSDKSIPVTLKAIEGIRQTQTTLDQTVVFVRTGQLKEASEALSRAKPGLEAFAAAAVDVPRLKTPKDEVYKHCGVIISNWFDAAGRACAELKGKVESPYSGKKFSDTLTAAENAKQQLKNVKAMTPAVAFLGSEDITSQHKDFLKLVDQAVEECTDYAKMAQGYIHWEQGHKQLKGARELARKAREDIQQWEPAAKALEEAIAYLAKAEALHPIKGFQTSLENAQGELKRLKAYKTPFDLDFARVKLPPDWSNEGKDWSTAAGWLNKSEVAWLKPRATAKATLKSPLLEWPRDFEFELIFAAVGLKGQVNNDLWKSHPALLTIRFLGDRDMSTLNMTVGRDPKSLPNQDILGITVNGKSWSLERHVKKNDPISLKVVAGQGKCYVHVNDWFKEASMPGDSKGIAFESHNATTAFPAVLRTSLKMTAIK